MPNGEASTAQAEQLYTLELLRQRTRAEQLRAAQALERQAKRAHSRETAPTPSATVGLMKMGENIVQWTGTLMGTIPYIGILFRFAGRAAKTVIKMMRVPLEFATRLAARREETTARKTATKLQKEAGIPTPPAPSPHGGGGGGIPLPGSDFLRPSDKPKELFGIIRVTPQLYRFLFIMGIALLVVGAILIIALTISTLCQGGLKGLFARFVLRLQTGISMPCP